MQGLPISLQDVEPYIAFLGTMIQLAGAALLAVLFQVVRRRAGRRKYMALWSQAWLALTVALGAVVLRYNILPNFTLLVADDTRLVVQLLYAIYQAGKLVFYALLTAGAVVYVRAVLPAHYVPLVGGAIVLVVAGSVWYASNLDQFVMLQSPAAVLATATCALMLARLPRSRRSTGGATVALACAAMAVLWGVYFAAFGVAGPLMQEYPGPELLRLLVRYNSYFDLVTHLALGYGMILVLMEDLRRETDDARNELNAMHDQLRRVALHDSVTGSLNRRAFQEGLGLEAARATLGALILLDLDDLRAINDRYGHSAGDALLRYLVEVLRPELRTLDKLYRWGGDEFLLVLPGADAQHAKRRFQEVLANCAPFEGFSQGFRVPLVVSLGAAAYSSAETLAVSIERAHADMYREKHLRRSGVQYLAPAS